MAASIGNMPLQLTVGVLCASYWRGAWYVMDYTFFPTNRRMSGLASLFLGSGLLASQQYVLSPSYNGTKFLVRMIPLPRDYSLRTWFRKVNRFSSLYFIALGCIFVWRGTWLLWDEASDLVGDAWIARRRMTTQHARGRIRQQEQQPDSIGKSPPARNPPVLSATSSIRDDDHHHHDGFHDAVTHHDVDRTLFYSGIAAHVCATIGLLMIGRFKSVMAPPANVSVMKDIFLHGKGKDFAAAAKSFARTV